MIEKFEITSLYDAQHERIREKSKPIVQNFNPMDYLSPFLNTDWGIEDAQYRLLCMQVADNNLKLFKEYYEDWSMYDFYEAYYWSLTANFNPNI